MIRTTRSREERENEVAVLNCLVDLASIGSAGKAENQQGYVVSDLESGRGLDDGITQRIEVEIAHVGQGGGEVADPVVEIHVAALDQPVGVEQERRSGLQIDGMVEPWRVRGDPQEEVRLDLQPGDDALGSRGNGARAPDPSSRMHSGHVRCHRPLSGSWPRTRRRTRRTSPADLRLRLRGL